MKYDYDAVMIGFGKGAKTLAADLAKRGEKVAIVERSDKMYGGTCINVGCIPTKSLVNSARLAAAGHPAAFREKAKTYADAIAEKNRLTAMLRGKNYDKIENLPNADVILGTARFLSSHELEVENAGKVRTISSDKIFINTGSAASLPNIEGLKESKRAYTSETLLELTELPRELAIVGGGYIGLEFASFYANFGSRVTVIQRGNDFIPREDREIAAEILKVMSEKVRFVFGAETLRIRDAEDTSFVDIRVDGKDETVTADAVLIAAGRRPNIAGLNLEAAGVETERGAVKTDETLRTSAPNIWAMGDVKGGQMFTYISLDDYRIVRSQLTGGGRTTLDRGAIPYSVFIDPPFSRVGMTAAEAREKGLDVAVSVLPAAAIPKAHVVKRPVGMLKAVVDKTTGKILGASIFAEDSHETINIVKFAMDAGARFETLRDGIYTHPTMSEALNDLFAGIEI